MQNVSNPPILNKPTKIKRSMGERIGYFIIMLILCLFAFSTVYPFWHVIMYSLSDSRAAMSGGLFFWPREFSLKGYEMVFKTAQIWIDVKSLGSYVPISKEDCDYYHDFFLHKYGQKK